MFYKTQKWRIHAYCPKEMSNLLTGGQMAGGQFLWHASKYHPNANPLQITGSLIVSSLPICCFLFCFLIFIFILQLVCNSIWWFVIRVYLLVEPFTLLICHIVLGTNRPISMLLMNFQFFFNLCYFSSSILFFYIIIPKCHLSVMLQSSDLVFP